MHEPVERVQFGVFEKFASAYLFQIAQENSRDYLLIMYMRKFRNANVSSNQEKLRHPGRALDLKAKDLIGHL